MRNSVLGKTFFALRAGTANECFSLLSRCTSSKTKRVKFSFFHRIITIRHCGTIMNTLTNTRTQTLGLGLSWVRILRHLFVCMGQTISRHQTMPTSYLLRCRTIHCKHFLNFFHQKGVGIKAGNIACRHFFQNAPRWILSFLHQE